MGGFRSRQPGFLQYCCKRLVGGLEAPFPAPLARLEIVVVCRRSRRKPLELREKLRTVLRALNVAPHCVRFGLDPLHAVLHEIADRHDSEQFA